MKLLMVGSTKVWALENVYKKELEKKVSVEIFNAHGLFVDYHQASKWNKIKYRLGLSKVLESINQALLKKVNQFKPDVIWVFKGMEILPKTLRQLSLLGIKLINFNGDHPFIHDSKGSGNKNVIKSIPFYDLHFTYSIEIKNSLKEKYNVSAAWLPFGFYKAIEPNLKQSLLNEVCFIGQPDKDRIKILNIILKAGYKVSVFGNNWNDFTFINSHLLSINQSIFKEEFNSVASKYRIQLNVFRTHNYNSHNMRTFEMPALGCIMLAPHSVEHSCFFEEGKEAFFYKNDNDLLQEIEKILSFSIEEIESIRLNAYNRSVKSNYSYERRASDVLNKIKEILKPV